MQQTETYNLNLIETSDTFSPNPLNENAQKLETALSAETAQRTAETAALDSRVTVLEAHKIAVGSYAGTGAAFTVKLGFTPVAVLIEERGNGTFFMATTNQPAPGNCFSVIDGGFSLIGGSYMNNKGPSYYYLAIS